ncbi:MAG TPA: DNA mismatch repair endonuclease MutL [Sphingobacteriaceae bacterium]|nr:DNA mismatch repair endonuclease MutL [Sphingobacteriaceae bacterium]
MPDIIQLLPDGVANQIAAGEVVQRPASAVKELIENAIDAGADQIKLLVRDAGKSLIQVIDNGCGMSAADARLSLQRHATSKIRRAEDLFAIRTMGFRGEAMASIAAIAQMELRTRRHEDDLGTVLEVAASEIIRQTEDAMPVGTSISVKNLFYNIPARRNFLKSDVVELRHIVDEFQRVALAHPTVHFTFHNDGNEIYHLPPGTLKQRVVHIFGNNYNERLVPIEEDTSIIRIKGFIGKPKYAKKGRGEQFFFVNKRFVKDAYLNHAILKAYEEVLPDDTYPLYILFIEIDPARIDINVHPTKTEIKYEDEKSIYAIVRSAVKRSLGQYNISPSLDFDQETGFANMIQPKPLDQITPPQISFDPDFNPFLKENPRAGRGSGSTGVGSSGAGSSGGASSNQHKPSGIPQNWEQLYEVTQKIEPQQLTLEQASDHADESKESEGVATNRLFQLHKRFIISQIHSGMMLIDQQAAHERILYEQFLQQLEARQGTSQQSLFPQTLDLDPADTALINGLLPEIQALGFQLREFGKNTFVIEGVPADLGSGIHEREAITQLLEDFKNNRPDSTLDKRQNLARSLARSAAIKAGTELSQLEMAELIDRLFACESANTSIQGKPIILTFTVRELLGQFQH